MSAYLAVVDHGSYTFTHNSRRLVLLRLDAHQGLLRPGPPIDEADIGQWLAALNVVRRSLGRSSSAPRGLEDDVRKRLCEYRP